MLFRGAAWYYARYRPPYPQEIVDAVARHARLDGTGRALDLGTGTGQLAFALAPHVEEVVAVDPQPEMLAEAAKTAPPNVRLVEARAEDVDASWGEFRVATAGRSFHWMDRDRVLSQLAATTPCVALTSDSVEDVFPYDVVVRIAREVTDRPRPEHAPHEDWEVTLRRHGYVDVLRVEVPVERMWTIDAILGWAFSTSFASPAVLGELQGAFEARVREELEARAEPLVERGSVDASIGRR